MSAAGPSPAGDETPAAWSSVAKRATDAVLSALLLVVLAPVLAVAALLVAVRLGRPVMFRQPRPGRDGRIFHLVKLRTMRPTDTEKGLVADADRLTGLGLWLRATSIDELPSLWNVLRGDMSLVGPRPLLPEYLTRYTAEQARRHEVRPGLTGLAQVRGRNLVDWDERLRLDVAYVDRRSYWGDLRILAATAPLVLRRYGVSASGSATMAEFTGSRDRA